MNHLTIDIGNTDTVFGYWTSSEISPKILRINTKHILSHHSLDLNHELSTVYQWLPYNQCQATMSSVVPLATPKVLALIQNNISSQIKLLDQNSYPLLPIEILRPDQIGADLVANALAAHTLYHQDTIIVDFGTAMSFTTVNRNGKILGVSIAPGLQTAIKSLTSHAVQLFEVPLEMPSSSLGQNTEHAIQAGIMYGYDGLVRGIIQSQEQELKLQLTVVATGGLSQKITTLKDRVDHFEPYLTLMGLKIAGQYI